jgi:hypothetical protein
VGLAPWNARVAPRARAFFGVTKVRTPLHLLWNRLRPPAALEKMQVKSVCRARLLLRHYHVRACVALMDATNGDQVPWT